MADRIFLNARYAFRSDILENWQRLNPILEKGEPAIISDGNDGEWLKIGDGVTPFNSLEWKKGPKGDKGPTPNVMPLSTQLQTNSIYRGEIDKNISFTLPTNVDTSILNAIELQVLISNAQNISIDLGAAKFFGDTPEFSDGNYIIYYEHNGQDWCVGALEIVGA